MRALHPLLRLAVDEPQLLAEHLAAYGALLAEEGAVAVARSQRRFARQALAGVALTVALTLAGVAGLLWAALPAASIGQPWLLCLVPTLPLLLAIALLWRGRAPDEPETFAGLRRQAAADLGLWRATARSEAGP
jgi:hypothetical protein